MENNFKKMVTTQDGKVKIIIEAKSDKKAKELASFLNEQAEIWLNKENLQKEMDHLDNEESERFEL